MLWNTQYLPNTLQQLNQYININASNLTTCHVQHSVFLRGKQRQSSLFCTKKRTGSQQEIMLLEFFDLSFVYCSLLHTVQIQTAFVRCQVKHLHYE